MAHRYGSLTSPAAATYWPDASETGKIADEVTLMGNLGGNADFPTDGSVHTIIFTIIIQGASGTIKVQNTATGETIVQTATTATAATIIDFGKKGIRVEGGWRVVMPANCGFTCIYDKVSK